MCADVMDENAHAALGVVHEGGADERAEGGVEETGEMLGGEMREKGVDRLRGL